MNKVMTIGGATYDIFLYENICQTQQYTDPEGNAFILIPQGRKVEFARLHYATGGGATNAAVAIRRQGLEVTAFFIIGDDNQGQCILRELTDEHVNIQYVKQLPGKNTGTSVIIPGTAQEKSLLVCHGASNDMQEHDIPWDALAQHKYVYIAPLPAASLLPIIVRYARKNKETYIAINPGTHQLYVQPEHLYTALPDVDCLILNTSEAIQLFNWLLTQNKLSVPAQSGSVQSVSNTKSSAMGPRLLHNFCTVSQVVYTLDQYVASIHALGPQTVVVTDGAHGVYVGNSSGIFFHQSVPVQVCNTVGAGDAFSGTFVASIARGCSLEQAIIRGVHNSSSVLQGQDAKSGLLLGTQLDQIIHRQEMSELQYFEY